MRRIRASTVPIVGANLARVPALDGLRALVTGAATGIGAATVERFEAEGAEVIGVDMASASVE